MEEEMRIWTITELMRMTRVELCALAVQIADSLRDLPDTAPERATALANLTTIRRILAQRDFSP
jgi:hypothetical protein